MDRDVRKAIRLLQRVGFEGLSAKELKDFRVQIDSKLLEEHMLSLWGLKVGDIISNFKIERGKISYFKDRVHAKIEIIKKKERRGRRSGGIVLPDEIQGYYPVSGLKKVLE